MSKMTSWHVGVAAEAFAAAQFARLTYDVSVQYGANQPEYDLIAVDGDRMLKISVKGSKDGSWGLTQKYKSGRTYQEAAQEWLNNHHKMLLDGQYHYDGCIGGKTGYTSIAGNTLVTFAERDGIQLICVVMKNVGAAIYTDTAALLDYGFMREGDR